MGSEVKDVAPTEMCLYIFFWFLFFHLLYRFFQVFSPKIWPETYNKLLRNDKNEADYWDSCVVSTIHGILVAGVGFYVIFTQEGYFTEDYEFESREALLCGYIITGYLISDAYLCLTHLMWPGLNMLLFHHFLGIYCFGYAILHHFGTGMVVSSVVLEATSPFINNRWFFDKSGYRQSSMYLINGVMITLSWFVLRISFFGWVTYRYTYALFPVLLSYNNYHHMAVTLVGFGGAYGLQVVWFQKIVAGMLKVLLGSKSKSVKDA